MWQNIWPPLCQRKLLKLSEEDKQLLRSCPGKENSNDGVKIIAVGDISLLSFSRIHAGIFDFRSLRFPISRQEKRKIVQMFKKIYVVANPPGTINLCAVPILAVAIKEGAGVYVAGEEDLLALPVILLMGKDEILAYGDPYSKAIKFLTKEEGVNFLSRLSIYRELLNTLEKIKV